MPTPYKCDLCGKTFKQKIDFTRHRDKKTPCISIAKIQTLVQNQGVKTENKTNLITMFNYCLDVLRDNEHLTGDKALRTLAHLLDLRLIEPHLDQMNIDGYDGYSSDMPPKRKEKLLRFVRFSNLAGEKEDNIPIIMKYVWDDILSINPITKNIFLEGKGFDIQHQTTYKKLIDKLYSFDFGAVDEDILGEAYEEVIKDVMVGKVLGQFFTPPKVKKMMVDLIDPKVNPNGTIETIFDPAMGTGGFLITCLRRLIQKSKSQEIPLNWEHIKRHGLGGREAEPDTYQLAVSNMLISSGRMFESLEKGDSIREPITNKYDIILANPPFGIKGLTYAEIVHPLRNEYMPVSSNSAVPLFLQAIIHMLKINGRCAMVCPEGQELFSKNKALVAVREYLMKTCDLKEVIYLPAGTFTHTSIKTCVFYFHKKKEGRDVLEVKLKHSKVTHKETGRTYVFSKTHQTRKVKFYEYNPENGVKHLQLEVDIEDIARNNYSLNYTEYLKDETEDEVYEDGVVVKTLGEVCEFKNGKSIKRDMLVDGDYPVIGGGQKPMGYHNEYNTDERVILCSSSGAYAGFISRYDKKVWASDCFSIVPKDNLLDTNYLFYVLKLGFQDKIYEQQTGTAQPHIYSKNLRTIKIPIPPIERQQEIVEYLDFIYEKCIKTSTVKILELKKLNEFCLKTQKEFGKNSVKTLGEVCHINPESMKKGEYTSINYIDISSVREGVLLETKAVSSDFPSRAKRIIKKGDILYSSVRPNLKGYVYIDKPFENCIASTGFAQIRVKDNNITLPKFVYYVMTLESISDILLMKAKGAQYPTVSFADFATLQIPIPPIERQIEIVNYCESNDRLIRSLEEEIERNKLQAKLYISSILMDDMSEEKSETPTSEPQTTSRVKLVFEDKTDDED